MQQLQEIVVLGVLEEAVVRVFLLQAAVEVAVVFACAAVVVVGVALRVLEARTLDSVQLMGFLLAKLLLVLDPQTARLVVVEAAADVAIVGFPSNNAKTVLKCILDLLFSENVLQKALIKTLRCFFKHRLFRVNRHYCRVFVVSSLQKDFSESAGVARADHDCLALDFRS